MVYLTWTSAHSIRNYRDVSNCGGFGEVSAAMSAAEWRGTGEAVMRPDTGPGPYVLCYGRW